MARILETNENGDLTLPRDVLRSAKPHVKYTVEVTDDTVVLHPLGDAKPFWSTASPDEWIASLLELVNRPRPPAPVLSDEAISRESIYG